MDIVQSFYDNIATQYDKLFADWQATTREQALILQRIFACQGLLAPCLQSKCPNSTFPEKSPPHSAPCTDKAERSA